MYVYWIHTHDNPAVRQSHWKQGGHLCGDSCGPAAAALCFSVHALVPAVVELRGYVVKKQRNRDQITN